MNYILGLFILLSLCYLGNSIYLDCENPKQLLAYQEKGGDTYILDLTQGETRCYRQLGRTYHANRLVFSPNMAKLYQDYSNEISVWDVATGALIKNIATNYINDWDLSADGLYIATISEGSKTINIWDSNTGSLLKSYNALQVPLRVRFTPSQKKLIVTTNPGSLIVRILDFENGKELKSISTGCLGGKGKLDTYFLSDGEVILDTHCLLAINLNTYTFRSIIRTVKRDVDGSGAISYDKKYFVSAHGNIFLYDFYLKKEVKIVNKALISRDYESAQFTKDGKYLILGETNGKISFWDMTTFNLVNEFIIGSTGSIRTLQIGYFCIWTCDYESLSSLNRNYCSCPLGISDPQSFPKCDEQDFYNRNHGKRASIVSCPNCNYSTKEAFNIHDGSCYYCQSDEIFKFCNDRYDNYCYKYFKYYYKSSCTKCISVYDSDYPEEFIASCQQCENNSYTVRIPEYLKKYIKQSVYEGSLNICLYGPTFAAKFLKSIQMGSNTAAIK